MWFSHLRRRWRYRQLLRSLRGTSVFETLEATVAYVDHTTNGHTLMFNRHLDEWVEMHFRLLHRQFASRKQVLKYLWFIYDEWKSASSVNTKATALGHLISYSSGLSYPGNSQLLSDYVEYLKLGK